MAILWRHSTTDHLLQLNNHSHVFLNCLQCTLTFDYQITFHILPFFHILHFDHFCSFGCVYILLNTSFLHTTSGLQLSDPNNRRLSWMHVRLDLAAAAWLACTKTNSWVLVLYRLLRALVPLLIWRAWVKGIHCRNRNLIHGGHWNGHKCAYVDTYVGTYRDALHGARGRCESWLPSFC